MLYAKSDDIKRCSEIVTKELIKNKVDFNSELLEKITVDVMNISYSKGGDYSDNIIQSFAKMYIEKELYIKYII